MASGFEGFCFNIGGIAAQVTSLITLETKQKVKSWYTAHGCKDTKYFYRHPTAIGMAGQNLPASSSAMPVCNSPIRVVHVENK